MLIYLPGTYTRTTALDILINAFLTHIEGDQPQTKQIISLGAGTDTRYFRLRSQDKHHNLIYHEFDFPTVSETKRRTVLGNPLLSKLNQNEAPLPRSTKPTAGSSCRMGIYAIQRRSFRDNILLPPSRPTATSSKPGPTAHTWTQDRSSNINHLRMLPLLPRS